MLDDGENTLPAKWSCDHVFVFIFLRFDEKCLNRKMNDSCNIRKLQYAISITLYFLCLGILIIA